MFWSVGYFVCSIGEVSTAYSQSRLRKEKQLLPPCKKSGFPLLKNFYEIKFEKNSAFAIFRLDSSVSPACVPETGAVSQIVKIAVISLRVFIGFEVRQQKLDILSSKV